ncbi:nascent polypeptide-associated complex subunit alpha, muscle-specific form-like [Arapaima gigas]
MKPDGVDSAMEPMEAIGAEPVVEGTVMEQEEQQAPLPSHPEEGDKQQQAEMPALAAATKEGNGKPEDVKVKAKAPMKSKPGTTVTKAAALGSGSRPGMAQNRGVQKPLANGVAKKINATSPEKKKLAATTVVPCKRPVATGGSTSSKAPLKSADKKSIGNSKPISAPAMTNGTKAVAAPQPVKKAPTGACADSTKPKPKTSVSTKPATTGAGKPERSTVSKTTRPAGGPPASTVATAKPATVAASSKPASSRAVTTAPSVGRNSTAQPAKTTAPSKKDLSKPSTAAVKKTSAPPSRPSTAKSVKTDPPKPSVTAKTESNAKKPQLARQTADAKPTRTKPQDGKPPVSRDVAASPRAAGSKPTPSKAATPTPKKALDSGTTMPAKRGPKPMQAVKPLAASRESPKKEPEMVAVDAKDTAITAASAVVAAVATAAAAVVTAAEPEVPAENEVGRVPPKEEPNESPYLADQEMAEVETKGVTAPQPFFQDAIILAEEPAAAFSTEPYTSISQAGPAEEQILLEAFGQPALQEPSSQSREGPGEEEKRSEVQEQVLSPRTEMEEDILIPEATAAWDLNKLVTESKCEETTPFEVPAISVLEPSVQQQEEAIEKAEEELNEDDDDDGNDEEDKEGSQQVSLSEMSGTQPTEESRPGSAGLAGSVWRGGALLSELDSEDVSCSHQGASEMSAPGVLEGTESTDDLGDASLKGADGEGASASSPDLEIVPDIPANEDEDEDDDEDRVYDMEVGSERAEDSRRVRQDGEDDEDDDVEMASEGVTESGLESYGNADEDDFAEDDRLDNLNRIQPPPLLPAAQAGQWTQANPFADPWADPPQDPPAATLPVSPPSDHCEIDSETPIQAPAQAWMELNTATLLPQTEDASPQPQSFQEPLADKLHPEFVATAAPNLEETLLPVQTDALLLPPTRGMSQSSTLSGTELAAQSSSETSTPEELKDYSSSEDKRQTPVPTQQFNVEQDPGIAPERIDGDEEEAETLPADEVLGGPPTAPTSAPSSPSISGDEASDTEGEMLIGDPDALVSKDLPAVEEREEVGQLHYGEAEEDGDTPQSANSVASYGFDCTTSNSNAHSTQSPGIFSLENEDQLPEEAKDPTLIKELTLPTATASPQLGAPVDLLPLSLSTEVPPNPEEQQYMQCGKQEMELPELTPVGGATPPEVGKASSAQQSAEGSDPQPPYYSAICEKTDSVLAGEYESIRFGNGCQQPSQPPLVHKEGGVLGSVTQSYPVHSCPVQLTPVRHPADLRPQTPQVQSNQQLRRLEQHQQQLQQIQQRQEHQSRERQKKLELSTEFYKQQGDEVVATKNEKDDNEERQCQEQQRMLEKQRQDLLQLQFQHQQQEQKHRQQILQWQQELAKQQLQQPKTLSAVLLSPTSALCTIYETMETTDEEEEEKEETQGHADEKLKLEEQVQDKPKEVSLQEEKDEGDSLIRLVAEDATDPLLQQCPSPDSSVHSPLSHSPHPQLDFDWGEKVDIVQQLINQTLLLAGDSCPPLLGGGGGTLSPLESSMWPSLLPPLTPSSATVTSVSSFSPEDQGSSPQGEWTVVELETHH